MLTPDSHHALPDIRQQAVTFWRRLNSQQITQTQRAPITKGAVRQPTFLPGLLLARGWRGTWGETNKTL